MDAVAAQLRIRDLTRDGIQRKDLPELLSLAKRLYHESAMADLIVPLFAALAKAPNVEIDPAKNDGTNKGIYEKYIVLRSNGSSGPGGKHEKCRYFVLDLIHDEFSRPAIDAYKASCREKFPELADDLGHIFCTGSPHFDGHSHPPGESPRGLVT